MRPIKVEIQNFLSFGDVQTCDLAHRGLLGVVGRNLDSKVADSNGAGKSSIPEAVVWALYGETMRGYRGDDVVNRVRGKDCKVTLFLEDDDRVYVICRTRKYSAVKKPNDVQVCVQEAAGLRDISAGTNTDTQEQINTIVGMDFMTFTQSVILRMGVPFSAMTDKQQKEVLEDILSTSILSAAQIKVKERVTTLQSQLVGLRTQQQQLAFQMQEVKSRVQNLTVQRNQHAMLTDNRRKDLVLRRVGLEIQLEDLYVRTGLDALLLQRETQAELLQTLEQRAAALQDRVVAITREYGDKKTSIAREEGMLLGRLRQIQGDLQAVTQAVGRPCSTCRQTLSPDAADACTAAWGQEVALLEKSLQDSARKKGRILADERRDLDAFAADRGTVRSEQLIAAGVLANIDSQVQRRSAELQTACALEQQIIGMDYEIANVVDAVNPYQEMIDKALESIEGIVGKLRSVDTREHVAELQLTHLNYWNTAFGNQGLKSYILDSVTPFLTQQAQYYSDKLSGGDIQIQFNTQTQLKTGTMKEQFHVAAYNKFGADVYQGNSDGEKWRVDFSVGWALGDLVAQRARKPIRLKILDEPFVHLDQAGIDAVLRMLHTEVSRYETILCITHDEELQSAFTNRITVQKKNGVSSIL